MTVFTAKEFKAIARVCHPDSQSTVEQRAIAFTLLQEKRDQLVVKELAPAAELPVDLKDFMARRAAVAHRNRERGKRAAATRRRKRSGEYYLGANV